MTIERYKKDIDRLTEQGKKLYFSILLETEPDLAKKKGFTDEALAKLPSVRKEYQAWYSEALAVIRQILPDRVDDFMSYYKPLKPRKELNASTYTISDFLQGISASVGGRTIAGFSAAVMPLEQQGLIVEALKQKFESSLFDIRALVQADTFDSELDKADELNKKGFLRGAGAIAGVVLEGHLATICEQHKIAVPANKTISTLNDLLKKNEVVDLATWRGIQHLGDLRNLCDHKKTSDPTKEQMHELVAGVRKAIKTIF